MSEKNLASALAYYKFMAEKNVSKMESYLHPGVQLISPLATINGIQAVLEAAKGFVQVFKTLTIRAQFSSENQVMLAMNLDCPEPLNIFRTASLLTFKDGLIINVELFYDGRPMEKHREEIFSSKQK